jgi:helicase|uniref:DEAD/DEAH box helicase n=1 Tax=Candidatus Aramenus sulfurataquae TaxID=1326980 RepID=A0AAE3K2U6_9CREN|nr:DEAD/DEAH box helicase [Candidatus Aramenus sulfurataquae]
MSVVDVLKRMGISRISEFQKQVLTEYVKGKENLLLEAPTGSGKTFLAQVMMLANDKKSVYVAPLKALTIEVSEELSKYTTVKMITGDVYMDEPDQVEEKVVVTTYEKMDSMIRRGLSWLDDVTLVIIDEIHNMRDPNRSPAIESVVEWALEKGKRLIMLSATIGNPTTLTKWTKAKLISNGQRPVPLREYIKYGNVLYDAQGKAYRIDGDLINEIIKKGKNVLIFENTRKRAETLANQLKEVYKDIVAFFHGGLSGEEKQKVISDIINGKYKIVVSTTALGQGVNLPIYAVVFRNVNLPVIENGRFLGWRRLNVMEYKQIAGRAGRPKYDKEGVAIVEAKTKSEVTKFIKEYLNGEIENVRGYLSLPDFILAYVTRETYATIDEIKKALSLTLSLANTTESQIKSTIDVLKNHGLVTVDQTGGISSTPLGRNIAYAYVSISDALYFLSYVDDEDMDIIYIVANSPKVVQVARGADTVGIVQGWVKGESEKDLTRYGQNLAEKDVKQIVETASWQAYTFYRVLEALEKPRKTKALLIWQAIQYGVPVNAVNLVKLQGIGRKTALKLYELGYTTKKEICENLNDLLPKLEPQLQWRVNELCKKQK